MSFLTTKTKSSILQFALLIAILVAFLLLSFITLTHTRQLFKIKSDQILSSIVSSTNGVMLSLEETSEISIDTLDVKMGFWGGYQKVSSYSGKGELMVETIALTGHRSSESNTALYLEDNINPLVLVGDTHIKGNVFVPQNGVNAGSIG